MATTQKSLKMLVDVEVAGGAVTSLTTGNISLVAGTVYEIAWGMNFNSTLQQGAIYFNNDQTAGNHRRTYVQSNNTAGSSSTAFFATNNGTTSQGQGIIALENGEPHYSYTELDSDENVGAIHGIIYGGYNVSETTITSVDMVASLGNLQNGSFIRIWKAVQST